MPVVRMTKADLEKSKSITSGELAVFYKTVATNDTMPEDGFHRKWVVVEDVLPYRKIFRVFFRPLKDGRIASKRYDLSTNIKNIFRIPSGYEPIIGRRVLQFGDKVFSRGNWIDVYQWDSWGVPDPKFNCIIRKIEPPKPKKASTKNATRKSAAKRRRKD